MDDERNVATESVWDYPRPPRLDPSSRHVVVRFAGVVIAETRRAVRVLETTHPPTYYIPPEDVRWTHLSPAARTTVCEYKGTASYYTAHAGDRTSPNAAWSYVHPALGYEPIAGYVAFYPQRVDECTVDGEVVQAQLGEFYGGWITHEIVGPFKGGPGTAGW